MHISAYSRYRSLTCGRVLCSNDASSSVRNPTTGVMRRHARPVHVPALRPFLSRFNKAGNPYSTNWSTMNLVAIMEPSWTLR